MKGLTLTQPWATLIAIGAKRIETHSWQTSYRGLLAIHAGQGLGPVGGMKGLHRLCGREPFASVLAANGYSAHLMPAWGLPRGCIVAVARLIDCVDADLMAAPGFAYRLAVDVPGRTGPIETYQWQCTDQERASGDYTPGRYAWLLADVRPLRTPVPCRGALGLCPVAADVQAQIEAQL